MTVAENLENGKYSMKSGLKSLLSWNIGDGLNIYNFATGENKQLDNANEIMLPIGYIGSDLVVAIESQNISNTINGKSTGSIFEKVSIYNNLLELQKEYTYDGRYIDNIDVKETACILTFINMTVKTLPDRRGYDNQVTSLWQVSTTGIILYG